MIHKKIFSASDRTKQPDPIRAFMASIEAVWHKVHNDPETGNLIIEWEDGKDAAEK